LASLPLAYALTSLLFSFTYFLTGSVFLTGFLLSFDLEGFCLGFVFDGDFTLYSFCFLPFAIILTSALTGTWVLAETETDFFCFF
jgi:hypothetical protein